VSRGHMDAFRVAHARARLMTGALALQLGSYGAALSKLKVFADDGFPPDERVWKECQASLVEELDAPDSDSGVVGLRQCFRGTIAPWAPGSVAAPWRTRVTAGRSTGGLRRPSGSDVRRGTPDTSRR
jgi:hypothetical protein